MTYEEAKAFLAGCNQYAGAITLNPLKRMLELLGNPQDQLKFIHIAGTNGKGSTLAYTSTALKAAGYRVGRYISPTIFSYRERIQVNEEYISREGLIRLTEQIKKVGEQMLAEGSGHPTMFEAETALAFLWFVEQKCDIVVLEVGMGGRFDATQFSVLFTVGLTVAVLVHLLFVQMLNEQVVQKKDSQYRATLEQERAEALMESYTTQRRLTHEFANHLEALSLMLQQNDVAGARGHLTSISKIIQMNSAILNTHNPLLDALLSKKYEEAARKGVMMYFDLSDLKDIPLDRTHLVIVVSNLLNNAIEAAAQAAPPEVHVRMKKTEGELVISVRNRVRQNVEIPEGQLPRSTKREPGHGMGLANVCAVLEAHNAEYTLSCRDNWFRFTCAFPTNGI